MIKPMIADIIAGRRPIYEDSRGYFSQLYPPIPQTGVPTEWAGENVSNSQYGVLRGMHCLTANPQGKLVTVLRGTIFDAWVDLRPDSPTFGRWGAATLSALDGGWVYLPPGLAHGFLVLSEMALVQYKVTAPYEARHDGGLHYADPDVGIDWPFEPVEISEKDKLLPSISKWAQRVD